MENTNHCKKSLGISSHYIYVKLNSVKICRSHWIKKSNYILPKEIYLNHEDPERLTVF